MIRLLKIYFGFILSPILLPLSLITLSWDPFRFFFLKRKKTRDGEGVYYLPEYSLASFKKTTIDSDIKAKHDLRTRDGKRVAFNEQNYRDQKHHIKEEIERKKRLKLLTSQNKNIVLLILSIFSLLFIVSFRFDNASPVFFGASAYITYSYFNSETIAKWFNALILKIRNYLDG